MRKNLLLPEPYFFFLTATVWEMCLLVALRISACRCFVVSTVPFSNSLQNLSLDLKLFF